MTLLLTQNPSYFHDHMEEAELMEAFIREILPRNQAITQIVDDIRFRRHVAALDVQDRALTDGAIRTASGSVKISGQRLLIGNSAIAISDVVSMKVARGTIGNTVTFLAFLAWLLFGLIGVASLASANPGPSILFFALMGVFLVLAHFGRRQVWFVQMTLKRSKRARVPFESLQSADGFRAKVNATRG
jgi:hypothetical protein